MSAVIFVKSLQDQKVSGLFWVAGIIAISAYVMALYPIIASDPGLNAFIQNLPAAMKAIFGGQLDYSTANSFLSAQVFSVVAPLVLIVYAVVQGVGAIAGEEEKGTLGLLLACPVNRSALLLQKAAAMLAGVVLCSFALWAGLLIVGTMRGVSIAVPGLTQGVTSLGLTAAFFGMLGLAAGAATGRKGIATGIVVGFAVATYLLNAFVNLVSWLEPGRFISPFYYYSGNNPLVNGLSLAHALILLSGTLVLLAFSAWAFSRRDLLK